MASISRFGRAVSSRNGASDRSLANTASVSSAVWSSRRVKSELAVTVVIQNSSQSTFGRTILYGKAFVNCAWKGSRRRKTAGKNRNYQRDIASNHFLTRKTLEFAHCQELAADRAGVVARALFARALLPRRPPGFGADGMALYHGRADVAAVGRSCRDVAVAAAFGGCRGGCEILPPPWHRLGRAARGDRRRRGRGGCSGRLDDYPAGGQEPVPVARPQRGPQGAGISPRDLAGPGSAETADSGNLSQHCRIWSDRPVWRANRRDLCLRPRRIGRLAPRSGAFGGDPAQSAYAQRT